MSKLIDLKGRKFGRLTVLGRDPDSPPDKLKWICQCECGSTISVLGDSLRSGRTSSCGCSHFPLKYDLAGKTFGFLLVQGRVENQMDGDTKWRCLCRNCGRTVEVGSYWLRHSSPYGHCKCTRGKLAYYKRSPTNKPVNLRKSGG